MTTTVDRKECNVEGADFGLICGCCERWLHCWVNMPTFVYFKRCQSLFDNSDSPCIDVQTMMMAPEDTVLGVVSRSGTPCIPGIPYTATMATATDASRRNLLDNILRNR